MLRKHNGYSTLPILTSRLNYCFRTKETLFSCSNAEVLRRPYTQHGELKKLSLHGVKRHGKSICRVEWWTNPFWMDFFMFVNSMPRLSLLESQIYRSWYIFQKCYRKKISYFCSYFTVYFTAHDLSSKNVTEKRYLDTVLLTIVDLKCIKKFNNDT